MRFIDLTGHRYSRLLVLSQAERLPGGGRIRWHCLCDCGEESIVAGCDLRNGRTKSCGCLNSEQARNAVPRVPLALRFWDKVAVGAPDECWEWQDAPDAYGYGRIQVGGKARKAHRIAWSLEHGYEPDGLILHHCDNRLCCNPAHLYEGTPLDNMQDKIKAGRLRTIHTGPMTPGEELATRGLRQSFN